MHVVEMFKALQSQIIYFIYVHLYLTNIWHLELDCNFSKPTIRQNMYCTRKVRDKYIYNITKLKQPYRQVLVYNELIMTPLTI